MPDVATIESRRRAVGNGKAGLPAIILPRLPLLGLDQSAVAGYVVVGKVSHPHLG